MLIVFFAFLPVFAQVEKYEKDIPDFDSSRYKKIDGFILDMGSMFDMPAYLMPPTLGFRPFDMPITDAYTINPEAVKIDRQLTLLGNHSLSYSPITFYSLLYPGGIGQNVQWQGASYRLNNGIRINTYGEYNADGYKVYNPAAMPWERNNFNAAFEVKSPDGKFGIKVEVHGGRKNAF